ncbi:MAG: RNA polymerase sigma-70 factor [Chitinophagaceae bacterium]|nr:RNA polymerase sigma-70 factor [Chitinophagaceae bacterium]MCW5926759.1 RNA polymerase sigma-70 factor [Chitinophagaceae bacterium]
MINNSYSDDALLTLFANGDQEAFTLLYERFYRQVLNFTRRYTTETDAQDITADAFVQLWRKREQFSAIKAIPAFLFIAARNRCYDLIRRKQVRSRYEHELLAMTDDHCDNDFFLEQIRLELVKLLRNEIDKLPEKMREVLLLSFRDGLKPAQIAEKLNISVKTVSNQKLSAIKILKSALHQYPLELMLLLFPYLL